MSLIDISHLSFAYDGSYEDIFTDVSFQIDSAWKLGLCGRNGRGKTTFLRLLMGELQYQGAISHSVDFEYFPFPVSDTAEHTLDIFYGLAPGVQLWQIQKELSKLAVGEDVLYRPFETLSHGERTKILLAGLFLRDNSFLLIDEPTDHLDMETRSLVARYLRGKSGFILVSHDRAFLDACTDHTLSINKANIEVVHGNFSVWWEQKRRQDAYEQAENERLAGEIGRLKISAARTAGWSEQVERSKTGSGGDKGYIGHQSAKMMKRAKNIENRRQDAIAEKSKLLKNIDRADDLKLVTEPYHASRLLSLENVSIHYGEKQVCQDVRFTVDVGDRLALTGSNGTGKSSLIKLICGETIPHRGAVLRGSRLIISYVPQDASFLAGDLRAYAREQQADETLFLMMLRKLDFSREQFDIDMCAFSAGQKKKVLLAGSLAARAHLYIWDEPLNYIDVLSRMQIEDLILAYRPTLLFVEHDRAFCENVATGRVEL